MGQQRIRRLPLRVILATGLFLCVAGVAAWLSYSWRQVDPLRGYREQPRYTRAEWHDAEMSATLRRLDRLTRKRVWSPEEAAFIRSLVEMSERGIPPMSPRALALAPVGIRDLAGAPREFSERELALLEPALPPFPPPGDPKAEAEWFMRSPEGREMARWLDMYFAVTQAESLIWDRRRLGIPVPESLERFGVQHWSAMMEDPDPRIRVQGAGRLIGGRFIENPEIRVRVEALRVGDPDVMVQERITRQLAIYDRDYHGIDPGPLVECNTCP